MEHQTTNPERILKLLQIIPRNCWINCKTNVSTERWNSRVEFHGKNDQPRNIYYLLELGDIWAYELFDGKPS